MRPARAESVTGPLSSRQCSSGKCAACGFTQSDWVHGGCPAGLLTGMEEPIGLEQYAHARGAEHEGTGEMPTAVLPAFVWRKQAKLPASMKDFVETRTGKPAGDYNCGELSLA